jgi:hypothetical protein
VGRDRLDPDLLDPDDPFELDMGNLHHMHKHLANEQGRTISVGPEDALDVFLFGDPLVLPGTPRKSSGLDHGRRGSGTRRVGAARASRFW